MTDPTPSGPLSVTNLPEAEHALRTYRMRQTRILILSIITLMFLGVLIAQGSLDLLNLISPSTPVATFILYGLSMLNFMASMLLLFVLSRNILKLIQERRQRKLGSKFKSQMVLGSLAISILPVVMLFFFAYSLVNRSLEKWFNIPAQRFEEDVEFIQDQMYSQEMKALSEVGRSMIRLLKMRQMAVLPGADTTPSRLDLDTTGREVFKAEFRSHELYRLFMLDSDGKQVLELGDSFFDGLSNVQQAKSGVARNDPHSSIFVTEDNRMFVLVGLPIRAGVVAGNGKKTVPQAGSRQPKQVGGLFLIRQLPPSLINRFDQLSNEARNRADLTIQNRRMRFTYLYILGFVTLLLVFGTTWIALYIARGITVPIQALAEGTHHVAQGNFDYVVNVAADNELAVLVNSFNDMASQLRTNRHQLEATATQLRTMNRALEERKQYIETILQSLFTGVVSLDAEQRVTTINQAGIELLRLDQSSIGLPVEQAVPAANRVEFQRVLRRTRRLGQSTVEVELKIQDQKPLHVAVSGTALRDEQGKYKGAVLMIEDLSPLIQAQQSAIWSEVARRMAHEIKNPLTPIQLCAERISRNIDRHGVDSERVRQTIHECTATISREVATLKRMVDEFSRFAKLPDAQPEPSSLNQVVREAIRLYDDRLDDIELETSLDETVPVLNIDREQFKRTLVNLIDNARHAIEAAADRSGNYDSGEKRITLATEYRPDQDLVRLSVSDTGQGISADDRERLFQPYFSTRKRGTGLGLAIVSHIVTDHNGRILVEENQPHGARFIIELPAS
ncbi:MAG TPA: ATP-binding protein [Acidobacteriota bacterium]|nr:ATP-binding protein [Acidobacteriota bacterium]HNG95072.1 ATP-binding protein [Acidobacteriota bacterium]HNH80981.1 ATP-binding protein [Acidobacteriota bacterium]